jgi:hypothetical protein
VGERQDERERGGGEQAPAENGHWGSLLAADEAMLDPAICRHGRFSAQGPSSRRKPLSAAVMPVRRRCRNHPIVIHGRGARSTPITSGSNGALPLAETAPGQ